MANRRAREKAIVPTQKDPTPEVQAKGKGRNWKKEKGKGKEHATSIQDQELEFVKQIDESSLGHAGNTQAAYKSTYRPYMVCFLSNG
jgi:hypothetical protein